MAPFEHRNKIKVSVQDKSTIKMDQLGRYTCTVELTTSGTSKVTKEMFTVELKQEETEEEEAE